MNTAPLFQWIDGLCDLAGSLQDGLFEQLVQPVLYHCGLAAYLEDAYEASSWLWIGVLQFAVLLLVIGPLERRRPVERPPCSTGDIRERRQAVSVDILYTVIDRLGLVRVGLFFTIDPLWNALFGRLTTAGWDGVHLDQLLAPWWPGVSDTALTGFLAYLLAFDLLNYLVHRAQHRYEWWWALHAVHHSQRHMTMWSDSRNHLLDSLLVDATFALCMRAIGAPPAQFLLLTALTKLVESLSHANLRLDFGWIGERLLVGPAYHRLHHAIGIGHEGQRRGTLGGCNFAVLLPIWDLLLGTARFDRGFQSTGIRDQLPAEGGRDYGRGFWDQQWKGLLRLAGRA